MPPPTPKTKSHSLFPSGWSPSMPYLTKTKRPRILFCHASEAHFGFTNSSHYAVGYKGMMYPTSEHLFQALKFLPDHPDLAAHILLCSGPSVAHSEAHRLASSVRTDWKQVQDKMMDETLLLKFTQHPELIDELIGTGKAELIHNSPADSYWGVGADGRGHNHLGRALETLRDKLRKIR